MDISIKNLSYTYHPQSPFERKVLHTINLEIKQGSWVFMMGQTGSGKSTLIQQLNGLLKPTEGSIQIGATQISSTRKKHPPLYKDVGIVFQYPEHQLFEETVAKDIAFGPKNLGWPEEIVARRVRQALELVGLDVSFLERSPFALSGGEKRRVALAGVLAMQPSILILDEPTAGLDPRGKQALWEMLSAWKQEGQRTIITISHQMDDVAEYADEVIVLHQGRVQWHTDPLTLFTEHRQRLREIGLGLPSSLELLEELNAGLASPMPYLSVKKEEIMQQIAAYFRKDVP